MLRMSVKQSDVLLIVRRRFFRPAALFALTKAEEFPDLVTFLGQELSANAKIDMDKDKDKIEKVRVFLAVG